ncbi:MAG TPA: polyprenyl synthetase family protein, partial [Alphaproteobacteria bacterium]|nr:polyprenyl synthetase family protein [Alphaproteobacteria bacterium]
MGSSSIIQSSTQQPDTLEKLQHLLKPELALINQLIIEQLQNRVALIPQLAGHIIGAGGKR